MKDKKKNDQILQEEQATDDLEIIELIDSADADDGEVIELTDKSFSEQEKAAEPDSDDDAEDAVIPEDSDGPVLLDDIAGEILTGDEELIEFDEMISLNDIAEEDVMEDGEVIDLEVADVTDHQDVTDLLPDDVSPGDEREFAESEIEESAAMDDMDENIADSADIVPDEDDEDVIASDMKNIRASSDSDEPVLLRESSGGAGENENADDFDDAETMFAPPDLDDTAGKDDDIVALEDEATIIAPPDLDETIFLRDDDEKQDIPPVRDSYSEDEATIIAPPDLDETIFLRDDDEKPDLLDDDDIIDLNDEAAIIEQSDLDETIFLRDDDEKHVPKPGLGNEKEIPPVRDSYSDSDDEATIIAPPDLDETIFLGDDEKPDQHDGDDIIDLNDEAAIVERSDPDETIFLRDDDEKHVPKLGLGNENRMPERGNGNPPVRDSDSYSGDEATIIAPPDLDGGDFFGDDDEKQDMPDDDDIIDLSDEESIEPDSDETIFIQDVAKKAVRQKEDDSSGLSDPDGTILFQDEAKKATEAYDIIELSPENIVAPPKIEDPTLSGEVISRRNKNVADQRLSHSDRDDDRPEDTGTPITDIDDVIRLADKASTDFKPASEPDRKGIAAGSDDILFGSEAEALLSESPYLSDDIPEIRDDKSESERRDKDLPDVIADDLKEQSGSPESASDEAEKNIPAEIPSILQKKDDTAAEAQPSDSKDIKEEINQKKPSDSAPRVRHLPDSVSLPPPEQLEAILEQVIKKVFSEKMFSEKIENKLVEVIEKAVANEMDRLKDVLFEDLADED